MRIIYKICPARAWRDAERDGIYCGSDDDARDGFIHFSTADQVAGTAAKHFAGKGDLLLIAVDADVLGKALRFEPSRGGALFPHLYGALATASVASVQELPLRADGTHAISGSRLMIRLLDALSVPLMRLFDPENAHRLAINGLRVVPRPPAKPDDARLKVRAFGLDFRIRSASPQASTKARKHPTHCCGLVSGTSEIGSVTPKPQAGNPRPRLFRLASDHAVINRMGFNNDGADAVLRRLSARAHRPGIVGVNLGANKDTQDRAADYVTLIERFAPVANYFTVNVSSPNTPGLRTMQHAAALDDLLARVLDARAGTTPVMLKIAPDLSLDELDDVVRVARARKIDGMIVANTTLARPPTLRDRVQSEQGGLSGRPLFALSTRMLAETYKRVEGAFPLIGVGGIDSGDTALAKIRAGATLIQLYSGLVYQGLGVIDAIKADLLSALKRGGSGSLSDIVGADAGAITAQDWPTQ